MPEFTDHTSCLVDWRQVSILSVESSRCERRYKDGLLLIGDSAHVMSLVGGVGINYAFQDVVAAANAFAEPLKEEVYGPAARTSSAAWQQCSSDWSYLRDSSRRGRP